jgi:hypothetical protein
MFKFIIACLGVLWGWACCMPAALAQQTIFNVPSADVTPKGQVYLETESQFRPWKPGRFWLGTHYAAVGVGHHTELDVTLLNVSSPDSGSTALGLGFKTAIPLLQKRLPRQDLKLTIGELMPVSLRGDGVGSWSYSHFSGRIPRLNTRVTAGVSTGTRQIFGRTTVNFIAGVEHPVTERFSIIADWFSGTHSSGYFIPGFSYLLPKNFYLFAGYQIPNTPRVGKSGFVIELSRVLP